MAKKRRANGEGSITQRKDGRWMARATLQTMTGPKPKSFYGHTRKEAHDKMLAALSASNAGVLVADDNTTLGELLQTWLIGTKSTLKPSSAESYERAINTHISPALGHARLRKLSAAQIQSYYAHKLSSGLSPATVKVHHAILHKCLKQAARFRMIVENPASLVTPPKAAAKK